MNYWRVLIPSWNFFDRMEEVPELLCRVRSADGFLTPWVPVFKKPARYWWHLFFNPKGNLYLASQGLVERLLQEISEAQECDVQSVTYQLVCHMVRNQLPESAGSWGKAYQFMIQLNTLQKMEKQSDTVFVSMEHDL